MRRALRIIGTLLLFSVVTILAALDVYGLAQLLPH